MGFDSRLTSTLTGVTPAQLSNWRNDRVLIPEISNNPCEYSFRDLVALRSLAFLRSQVSLQKIKRALDTLSDQQMKNHLSEYVLGTDGNSIIIETEAGSVDLVKAPGNYQFRSFDKVFKSFTNSSGQEVVDFYHPRTELEVEPNRLGGFPTLRGTRIPYDIIADMMYDDDMTLEELHEFYPDVTEEQVRDAVEFQNLVEDAA